MRPSQIGLMAGLNFTVRISSSIDNYDLRSALGSPSGPMKITVIVDSGVTIGSADEANPAFTTGSGWTAGTVVRLLNSGKIYGRGGDGGKGGYVSSVGVATAGVTGKAGGNAVETTVPLIIDNTSGEIFGGGGGGGGGQGFLDDDGIGVSGSGGGGGQGYGTSSGGAAGNSDTQIAAGNVGTGGSASSAGAGGAAAHSSDPTDDGGAGGSGGAWGAAGTIGGEGSIGGSFTPYPPPEDGYGSGRGAAGAGGYAVKLNGQSVSWIAGNNGTQVKGTVG